MSTVSKSQEESPFLPHKFQRCQRVSIMSQFDIDRTYGAVVLWMLTPHTIESSCWSGSDTISLIFKVASDEKKAILASISVDYYLWTNSIFLLESHEKSATLDGHTSSAVSGAFSLDASLFVSRTGNMVQPFYNANATMKLGISELAIDFHRYFFSINPCFIRG